MYDKRKHTITQAQYSMLYGFLAFRDLIHMSTAPSVERDILLETMYDNIVSLSEALSDKHYADEATEENPVVRYRREAIDSVKKED